MSAAACKRPSVAEGRKSIINALSCAPTAQAVTRLEVPGKREDPLLVPDRGHALSQSVLFLEIKTKLDIAGIFVRADHALLQRQAVSLGSTVDPVDLEFFFGIDLRVAETPDELCPVIRDGNNMIKIEGAESVSKSFPSFFKTLFKLTVT